MRTTPIYLHHPTARQVPLFSKDNTVLPKPSISLGFHGWIFQDVGPLHPPTGQMILADAERVIPQPWPTLSISFHQLCRPRKPEESWNSSVFFPPFFWRFKLQTSQIEWVPNLNDDQNSDSFQTEFNFIHHFLTWSPLHPGKLIWNPTKETKFGSDDFLFSIGWFLASSFFDFPGVEPFLDPISPLVLVPQYRPRSH